MQSDFKSDFIKIKKTLIFFLEQEENSDEKKKNKTINFMEFTYLGPKI
jgi:hypothetical protein